jgi:hypothetical protein
METSNTKVNGRAIGYYKVVLKGVKIVAQWNHNGYWLIAGTNQPVFDGQFSHIGDMVTFD